MKKRSRTFVINSSNPYAAAAAMGMAVVRNESSGNYFDPISGPITGGRPDPLAQSQSSAPPTADPMLKVDFRADWAAFIRSDMTAYGLTFSQSRTLEQNTDRYLNAKRRIPRQGARTIHESEELRIPPQYAKDYSALAKLIREGGDLEPYLSRDIRKKASDKNDPLLNRWGIQHLHFRRGGSDDVLFVKITDTDVFVIQAFPHDDPQVWVNTSLLQILHDNWPESAEGRVAGIPGECLVAGERLALQYRNRNFATAMSDGAVYLSPGGGVMDSGQAWDVLAMRHKSGNRLGCYLIDGKRRDLSIGLEIGDAVFIKANSVRLCGRGRSDKREEQFVGKTGERGHGFFVPDADLTTRERRLVRRLDLFSEAFVCLLRALADLLTVPSELIPPVFRTALLVDCHLNCLSKLAFRILLNCRFRR